MTRERLSRMFATGGAVWLMVIAVATFAVATSADFRSGANLSNLSRQMVVLALVSLAQFVVVLAGGVDMSIAANARLAAIVAAIVMDGSNGRFMLGLGAAVAVAVVIGALNGAIAVRLRVEPFIATLGTGAIVNGLALHIASTPQGRASPWWTDFYSEKFLGVPLLVLIAVLITALVWTLLMRRPWGRHIYAVGGDRAISRLSGLRVDRVAMSAYLFAGILGGIAGLVIIGATGVGDSSAAASLEFESLAVVVIGGTSLAGGSGRLYGVVGGIILFGMLGNVFNMLDVEVWYQQLVRGTVILVAASLYVKSRPSTKARLGESVVELDQLKGA